MALAVPLRGQHHKSPAAQLFSLGDFARMKFTPKDWVWFAICTVIALYAVGYSIQANRLRQQLDNLKVFKLSVQAIDQKTGRPTDSITVSPHPDVSQGQIMKLWSSSGTASGSLSFEYIGTPPFAGTVSVTNAGYQEKVVSFDSTNSQLMVYLIHKT